jgi:hypothetical protein
MMNWASIIRRINMARKPKDKPADAPGKLDKPTDKPTVTYKPFATAAPAQIIDAASKMRERCAEVAEQYTTRNPTHHAFHRDAACEIANLIRLLPLDETE